MLADYTITHDAATVTELPSHIKVVFQAEKDRAQDYTMAFYHHDAQENMLHVAARVAPQQHMVDHAAVASTGGNWEAATTVPA